MIQFDEQLQIFVPSLVSGDGYYAGFVTKAFGDSMHVNNVVAALKRFEMPYKTLVIPEQIHSVNIETYDKENGDEIEKIPDTDAVVTKQRGVVLIVRTADCIPMIVCDKKRGIIGISHQGWRGSLKQLPKKLIGQMQELGSEPADIVVGVGPSIGACCYDVDDDRYYTFLSELNGYSEKIFHIRGGKRYLDLTKLTYLYLVESGVKKEHIDFFPFCTQCDKERFFSFRRKAGKDYEEMFSFILMRS